MESHEHSQKCKEVFAMLSDYLDLELPLGACEEVAAHLAGCPPCIEFAESLRKTVELCGQYHPAVVPEPLGKHAREQLLEAYRRMLKQKLRSES